MNNATATAAVKSSESTETSPTKPPQESPAPATESAQDTKEPEATSQSADVVEGKPAHPEYDRFVKMVQVGVPLQAVKLKLQLEGLDPNVLDEVLGK